MGQVACSRAFAYGDGFHLIVYFWFKVIFVARAPLRENATLH
jgi:hypothetical protein